MDDPVNTPRPNAVIVGAAKAGTTSLYNYLCEHPEVFLPRRIKELNFLGGVNQAVASAEEYYGLYEGSAAYPVRMDISTSYLYEPGTAQKIRDALGPDVKIIAILRDPVEASYSMWKQIRHFGDEPLSFEDALAAEEGRRTDPAVRAALKGWAPNFFYTHRHCYAPQLQQYFDVFPAANIKIFIFEELFGDLRTGWAELCRFLGIDPSFVPANMGGVYNPGSEGHRSELLHKILYRNLWWKKLVTWLLSEKLKAVLRRSLDDLNKKKDGDAMSLQTRRHLRDFFAKDKEVLEKLLNRSLAHIWRK